MRTRGGSRPRKMADSDSSGGSATLTGTQNTQNNMIRETEHRVVRLTISMYMSKGSSLLSAYSQLFDIYQTTLHNTLARSIACSQSLATLASSVWDSPSLTQYAQDD